MKESNMKAPRTMKEAFGPYTDNMIFEKDKQMDKADKIALIAGALAMALLLGMMIGGYVK